MPSSLYKKAILDLIKYVKDNEDKGVNLDGIFRERPDPQAKINAKKAILFNEKPEDIFQEIIDPHTPSNLIKEYLRLLNASEPFFSNQDVKTITSKTNPDEKLGLISNHLNTLENEKKLILSKLFEFLHQVKDNAGNQMTSGALATCIGPNLVDPELLSIPALAVPSNSILQIALDNYNAGIREALQVDEATTQEITESWEQDISMSMKKSRFISKLKTDIEGKPWKTGLFGGEKVDGMQVKLPKHVKEMYVLCNNLSEDNVEETFEKIKTILKTQKEGQKGHLLFFHRRHDDTQKFYNEFFNKAEEIIPTDDAESTAETSPLLS